MEILRKSTFTQPASLERSENKVTTSERYAYVQLYDSLKVISRSFRSRSGNHTVLYELHTHTRYKNLYTATNKCTNYNTNVYCSCYVILSLNIDLLSHLLLIYITCRFDLVTQETFGLKLPSIYMPCFGNIKTC